MRRFLSLGLLCLMLLGTAVSAQAQSSSSTPDDQAALALLTALDVDSYRDKGEAITAILQSDDERARDWLQALLDGRLQRTDDGRFVLVLENRGRDWPVADALTNEPLGEMSRRDLDRIGINNALRNQLRSAIAVVDLYSPNVERRRTSADRLLGEVDGELADTLEPVIADAEDEYVRTRLAQAVAIYRAEQG
ncbi:MAG TPA: urea ABC transporter permease subunit UrtB, partial [Halomonas sp.]|nr:urea ABC transporter permease subunit UrtB [Halomonas sp.]